MSPNISVDISTHISVAFRSIFQPKCQLSVGWYVGCYVDQGVHKLCKIPISTVVCSIHLIGWPTAKLTDWLTDCLTVWLTEWLTDLLVYLITEPLTEWLFDWQADLLTDCLVDWPTDWLINWLIDRLNGWLVDWLNDLLTYWENDWLTHWLKQWHRFYTALCHSVCIDSTQCLILQGLLIDSLNGWLTVYWPTNWLTYWWTGCLLTDWLID